MATGALSQAGYDKALAQFGEQGTVELISTIGYYAMVGNFPEELRRAAARRQHATEIKGGTLWPVSNT